MTRYTLFVLIVLGSAASAIAAIAPDHRTGFDANTSNVTVMHKNQAFPLVGPFIVEDCVNEDCSSTTG
jgi:hypothetical protein